MRETMGEPGMVGETMGEPACRDARSSVGCPPRGASLALVFALVLALTGVPPAQGVAGPVDADYFCQDAPKDAIFMEMATHPQALCSGDLTFVCYQGPGLDPYAAAYDHARGEWRGPYRVGANPLVNDFHGAPAMLVDREGYVHVFYGGHHDPLRHARSRRPRDVSSWVDMPDVTTTFTYPQPILMDDGSIEIYYRDGSLDWLYRRSTDNGASWSPAVRVLDAVDSRFFYANFNKCKGGGVLAAFVSIDLDSYKAGSWARRDVHFMRRDEAGIWRSTLGQAIAMPLRAGAAGVTRIVDSQGANANHVLVKAAPDGDPCLLFSIGSGSGPASYEFRFMRLEAGSWRSAHVGYTDHFYDACTFRFDDAGRIRAYTIEGGSPGLGRGDRDYFDDAGFLAQHVSEDGGDTWSDATPAGPGAADALFNNPSAVLDATSTATIVVNEWTRGPSLFGLRLYLLGDEGDPIGRSFEPKFTRVASADRIGTAALVSRESFPNGASTAVLVSQHSFADALTGAPLAYAYGGPVLLTRSDSLSPATAKELARLNPARVVVVGGPDVVGAGAVAGVRNAVGGVTVDRLAGSDRYETAVKVAWRLRSVNRRGSGTAFVVRGTHFADGLACSAWAAYRGYPILLSQETWLPPVTRTALRELGVKRTIIVGDTGVVAPSVERSLPLPRRLAGADRYETAARVAEASLADGMLSDRVVVASGAAFPDPLAGSVLAARLRAPLLLSAPRVLGPDARQVIGAGAGSTTEAFVVGGRDVVSENVGADVLSLIRD